MRKRLVKGAKGDVIVAAVHLCGVLSFKACDIFNEEEKCTHVLLKPCCLPGRCYLQYKDLVNDCPCAPFIVPVLITHTHTHRHRFGKLESTACLQQICILTTPASSAGACRRNRGQQRRLPPRPRLLLLWLVRLRAKRKGTPCRKSIPRSGCVRNVET